MIGYSARAISLERERQRMCRASMRETVVSYGIFWFDLWSRWLWTDESGKVRLSEAESVVFRALGEADGNPVSQERLIALRQEYFGAGGGKFELDYKGVNIATQISHLRKKIAVVVDGQYLMSEPGRGYSLFS